MASSSLAKTVSGAVAQSGNGAGKMVKSLLNSDSMKHRFGEVMGAKAPQFMSSIVNLVNSSQPLQGVDGMSVISSAMVAATLDLPIDPNLGYMYIVPFNEKQANGSYIKRAQPQMGYKGYIQLALRSGQYKAIEAGPVYEGEMTNWDRFTGHYERGEKISDKVVGYFGHFELINGFEKTVYWTAEEMDAHRVKFSKSGNYNGKPSGTWKSNYEAMATKTVIRNMLSKWGILSIEMQDAVVKDERPQVYDAETGELSDDPKWAGNAAEEDAVDPGIAAKADAFFNSQEAGEVSNG
ncbi:recombinase RecT [Lacticaseibacillus absianus]|uniref:recombinase RecT n=1 Tax=Lacticaseibacillus absianus TaxID=2729623 RepID=UPI0015CB4068|nr:recombinase RecT [Lacticaseibacillus absianus]